MQSLQQTLRLTWRLCRRAIGQRANHLLSLCIVVCACVSASLSLFSSSVQSALDNDIANFLGAPLVVRSNQPIATTKLPSLKGLRPAVYTGSFTTGAVAGQTYQSITLKGVSSGYPLQGELLITKQNGEASVTGASLDSASAWLDRRALDELKLKIGQQLQIGKASFTVGGEILFEPDRLTQLQHALPRVIVTQEGLAKTAVSVNNNRGEYRALYGGEKPALDQFEKLLPSVLQQEFEVLKPASGKHPFSRMSLRAERMLNVILVLILLMCGGAAATLADHSARGYAATAAVLRCMGVYRQAVTLSLCLQLAILALLMSIVGCAVAWLIHPWLIEIMEPHMSLQRAVLRPKDFLAPMASCLLMVVAFVVPKLRQLGSLPVSQILRGQFGSVKHGYVSLLCAFGLIIGLLFLTSDNHQLTAMMVGAIIMLVLSSLGLGWCLSKLSSQCHHLLKGPLKIAVRAIGRSPARHSAPMISVAVATMAILMTVTLRGSFLDALQIQTLETDGNYIVTGLPETDRQTFTDVVTRNQAELKGLYPTVSARLIAINGVPIDQALNKESDTREEARSKVRLSWSESTPQNNKMLKGDWPAINSGDVSVEHEVMGDLGLSIGDQLSFEIEGAEITSTISSTREYKGGGSRVMFWFMFAPDTLASFEQRMMGGIIIRDDHQTLLSELGHVFPQMRITSLEKQIASIRSIMTALTRLLNTTLILLMSGALMVIVASSFANTASRQTQLSLMRALGLQRKHCYAMNIVEQLTVGLVACIVGVLGVQMIAGLMFHNLFALSYQLDWGRVATITITVCASFVLLGWGFAFRRLRQPVQLSLTS